MLLTGILYDAGGPLASVTITFEATQTTQNGVILGADRGFTTNEDGTYSISLEPGYYNVFWNERGHRVRLGTVTADEFTETSLPAALQAEPMPVDSSAVEDAILEALQQMQADLDASTAARDAAQQAQADAEAARDAASVAGKVYADTAAGLAATVDGEYFKTPAASAEGFLTLYRNDAGSATAVETFPSLNGLTAAIAAANEKATRLNRSFSLSPFAGESLRLDFANQAFGQGDTTGISQSYGIADLLTVQRASTATYWDALGVLQTAAVDEARFDHDPVTGEPLGVLIEEGRTNYVVHATDLTDASWSLTGATVSADAVSAFDGGFADKLVESSVDENHYAQQETDQIADNSPAVASAYLKAGERKWARIRLGHKDGFGPRAWFDLENGLVGQVDSGGTAYIRPVGNGWYRCVLVTSDVKSGSYLVRAQVFAQTADGETTYLGDGASGIYVTWAQLEASDFETSPIPSAGSAVTRAADDVLRTMAAELSEQGGTIFAEFSHQSTYFGDFFGANDQSINNRFSVNVLADGVSATVGVEGNFTNAPLIPLTSYGIGVYNKAAMTFDIDLVHYAANGTSATETNTAGIPSVSQLDVGRRANGANGRYLNGHIKRLEYYPNAMTATELEALTA